MCFVVPLPGHLKTGKIAKDMINSRICSDMASLHNIQVKIRLNCIIKILFGGKR